PREDFIKQTEKGLQIKPFDVNIKEVKPTSTLFYRQQHTTFSFTTTMDYKPKSESDLAGITALQNEGYNFVFGITKHNKKYYIVLKKTEKGNTKILASKEIDLDGEVQLKVEADHDNYTF